MTVHMKREIDRLKQMLTSLCEVVEKNLRRAVESIRQRDAKLAKTVIDMDVEIDHIEVDMEEECLKILALYQPVAIDLRFIVTALKINNDLERIGDLAVNLAEHSTFLASRPKVEVPFDFNTMTEKTELMLPAPVKRNGEWTGWSFSAGLGTHFQNGNCKGGWCVIAVKPILS